MASIYHLKRKLQKDMLMDIYNSALPQPAAFPGAKVFYVDPTNGLDANDGLSPDRAFLTLTAGEDALTANKNETLVLIGNNTSVTKLAATLTWNKNYTHMIGACSPVHQGQRSRIFGNASNSSITPLIDITASGCAFKNLYVNYGVDDAGCLVPVQVTGARNYFENCHFTGINNATQDASGACSLKLNGAAECTFVHCSIGSSTQTTRAANTSEILTDGVASSMFFEDCYIYAWISNAGHTLVKAADSEGMAGTWLFKNTLFESMFTNNATAMSSAFSLTGSPPTLYIILDHCVGVHITAWDSGSNAKTYIANMPIDSNTDGIAVAL